MSQNQDDDIAPEGAAKTPAQTMAELVAKRKAALTGQSGPSNSRRGTERAAAAHSASKSKPALRKS